MPFLSAKTYTNSPKLSDFEQKVTKRTKAGWYFLELFVTFVFFCKVQKIRTSHNQFQYKSIGSLVSLANGLGLVDAELFHQFIKGRAADAEFGGGGGDLAVVLAQRLLQ